MRNACKTSRECAIVETLLASGCRVSELARLKKEDVDFKARKIKLYGKGRKRRTVPINARAVIALQKYQSERTDTEPYMIVGCRRPYKRMTNAGIEKIVRNIGNRAGVENVYPHRFRHTFATMALAHGMELVVLQSILGHEKSDTTMIYARVLPERIEASYRQCVA